MALESIDAYSISFSRALPTATQLRRAYYLGYRRNAWHSTRVSKYNPNCVSFNAGELKDRAERLRTQGSVFRIAAVPILVLEYKTKSLGIVPINDGGKWGYEHLLEEIDQGSTAARFWQLMPSSYRNWMLAFKVPRFQVSERYVPSLEVASSYGGNYRLAWSMREGESYSNFCWFAARLRTRLRPKDPALSQRTEHVESVVL